MIFRAVKPSHKLPDSVYLFAKTDELKALALTDEELAYVQKSVKGESSKTVYINRYSESLYLVNVKTDKKDRPEKLREECRIAGNKVFKMIKSTEANAIKVQNLSPGLSTTPFAEGIALGAYQFLKYFSDKQKKANKLKEICIAGAGQAEIDELTAIVTGVYKARDLVNEPVVFLTATQLAKEAKKAGEQYGFKVEVLNKKKIETLKMGGLLAVNKGSVEPPAFIIMEHLPDKAVNKAPLVVVGKGVVYDTGGLSLKPTPGSMDSMKSDMSGAAAVIGLMVAIAQSKVPVHVIGLVPATDNRPGENAYTPGDIIKMYDGTTVEVLNTDAEGRMILADALTYAKKYKPQLVFDIATLTGAAAVAIGKYGVVAMGNASEAEFRQLTEAGDEVYERIARFPFWDEYNELLKSSVADVKNIGGREGGAITAGKFLERFTDYPFIHLDIAGPAFLSSDSDYRLQGGTGVGVRLLYNYLKKLK